MTFQSLNSIGDEQETKETSHKSYQTKQASSYEESSLIDFDSLGDASAFNSLDHHRADMSDSEPGSTASNMINLPPKSMADLLNKANDFKSFTALNNTSKSTPPLAYWYGLCKFVTIKPVRSSNFIESERKANLMLSSAAIAINNTGWW